MPAGGTAAIFTGAQRAHDTLLGRMHELGADALGHSNYFTMPPPGLEHGIPKF